MSLFNFQKTLLTFILLLLTTAAARAQDATTSTAPPKAPASYSTWSVSYISWTEFVELTDGTIHDDGFSNFYGNALTYQKEVYSGRAGFIYEFGFLSGQANAGGSQQMLTYQTANQKWFGGEIGVRAAYRATPQIALAVGPIGLYRGVKFPTDGGVEAKSGADFNFGMLLDLRLRLTKNWELQQSLGTLSFRASTLWSLGIGYKY